MHGTYLFLFKMESERLDSTEAERMKSLFESQYERYCDENNWYTIAGVAAQGLWLRAIPEGKWQFEEATKSPMRLAMEIAASDLYLKGTDRFSFDGTGPDRLDTLTNEALMEAITTEIPEDLARRYSASRKKTAEYCVFSGQIRVQDDRARL